MAPIGYTGIMASLGDTSADLGELFHGAFRGLRRTWAEQLAPFELTPHQWRALATLLRHSPGAAPGPALVPVDTACAEGTTDVPGMPGVPGVRLKDLAERLRIAPRSATEVVDQLQQKGLVRRDADPSDRRATLLVATDAGEQLFAEVSANRRDKSNEYFARLSDEDRAQLARILGKLRD